MNWRCGKHILDLTSPKIMGILNITPDSFFDGGRTIQENIDKAHQLIDAGADLLDIGAESTKPGSQPVGVEEELKRLSPVLAALKDVKLPISVDTYKPEVMRFAIDQGVDVINDIYGARQKGVTEILANSQVGVCLMHMQGDPKTMQNNPTYQNVCDDVRDFLQKQKEMLLGAGVTEDRIVLDPGFGFGKTKAHNIQLLHHLSSFLNVGSQLLVGLSRKSVLGRIMDGEVEDRLIASIVVAVIAIGKGAKILRVHDVKETKQALKILSVLN